MASPRQKATSPPKQTDPNRELLLVILKGLIAGAAFGMLLIVITGYLLFFR
jgi:LPS O-antigen subunit length determinant protein (WzzB/FepE family)